MKSLILNGQGHSDEAFALAKIALRNDMKSHICWHVYGLLYRSAKNFEESIKAYKYALKLEPESQQIQRDLALLQMQMRDYAGYLQSRRAMLQARPGLRSNWTALAVAQHLAGDLAGAERTLSTYEETLKQPPPKTDVEHQEALLYKNAIIAEMNQTEKALDHLDAVNKYSYDRQTVMEMRASYQLKLGRNQDAVKIYRDLLERNAENREYYDGLRFALKIDASDVNSLSKLYAEYAEKSPRHDAPRRIPLDFLEGSAFREAADQYLQRMLSKGVPSTFANVKSLYIDRSKQDTIQDLVQGYSTGDRDLDASVKESSRFDVSVLYFLAQHFNYYKSRDLSKAMDAIEKAIEKDPESVDYHMTKARILKHHGDLITASEIMDKARSLDERDRHINSKAAKYQLRNDQNDTAVQTMGKFTRNEAVGGPLGDLTDMQCMWFLTEDGESYLRQQKLGLALKRFTSILNIFEIWTEDQFDFHSFSIRKGQIRAYVEMVRWEDHLRDHPFFARAAVSAVRAYVLLHDRPQLAHSDHLPNGTAVNGTDASERKKAARKARKAQEKLEQLEAEKKDAKKTAGGGGGAEVKKEDPDPTGKLLLQTPEPLKEAMKFVAPLLEMNPRNLDAQAAAFEVFLRKSKPRLGPPFLFFQSSLNTTPSTRARSRAKLLTHPQRNTSSPCAACSPPTPSHPPRRPSTPSSCACRTPCPPHPPRRRRNSPLFSKATSPHCCPRPRRTCEPSTTRTSRTPGASATSRACSRGWKHDSRWRGECGVGCPSW